MMKTESCKRVIIKIGSQEQHENVKNQRKTLKVLQQAACDKENLVGRPRLDKDFKSVDYEKSEAKRKKMVHKGIQTGDVECLVTADDLTSEEPSEDYWRLLAEKRGMALNDSFKENERLKDQVDILKEENKTCKEMLNESKNLVEVLQEMLEEQDQSTEIAEEAEEEL